MEISREEIVEIFFKWEKDYAGNESEDLSIERTITFLNILHEIREPDEQG